MNRLITYFSAMLLANLAACHQAERQDGGPFEVSPLTFNELKRDLLQQMPDLEHFDQSGPFASRTFINCLLKISPHESFVADIVMPEYPSFAPVVVFSHGNHSRKEAHRYQAERLASFGMIAIVLQMPNYGRWLQNGAAIARLIKALHRNPGLIATAIRVHDVRHAIDRENIVLIGHSFGGSAMTVAIGRGAPAKALILLDPAVVSPKVIQYMKKARVPTMLLGADRKIFRAKKRYAFYRHMGGEFSEVSIAGATHDDAQHPSMFALTTFGVDPFTAAAKQGLFSAVIVASAFSLTATDGLDYVWKIIQDTVEQGAMKQARRRQARVARGPSFHRRL